ncbi:MAG TPA: hypothetical protein VFY99_02540 [Solirubrobacterales bacterium]
MARITEKHDDESSGSGRGPRPRPVASWLARELLPDLVEERAAEGLLVHGPW